VSDASKIALIVGMDTYDNNDLDQLPSCKRDAEDLHELLRAKFGYTIFGDEPIIGSKLTKNYGWAQVHKAISEFFNIAKPSQTLLFYFSGHGITKGGEVYLATPSVDPKNPFPEGFSLSKLTDLMGQSKSKQLVGIIDACFAGAANIPNKRLRKKALKLKLIPQQLIMIKYGRRFERQKEFIFCYHVNRMRLLMQKKMAIAFILNI
jgi:uncharacterized caspase-like protein